MSRRLASVGGPAAHAQAVRLLALADLDFLGSGFPWFLLVCTRGRSCGVMPSVTLKAHYDGERIQLDEPFDLPRNALLLVTVLSPEGNGDRVGWLATSSAALARAFGDNEPEYTQADIRR